MKRIHLAYLSLLVLLHAPGNATAQNTPAYIAEVEKNLRDGPVATPPAPGTRFTVASSIEKKTGWVRELELRMERTANSKGTFQEIPMTMNTRESNHCKIAVTPHRP